VALILVAIFTCCIGYILAAIPFGGQYIGALISLPVLVFDRAYTLHFVSQFGPEYAIGWQVPPERGFPVLMNDPTQMPPPPPPPSAA